MVGAGFVMLALAVYALFLTMGEMLEKPPRLLRYLPFAIALPYLATTTGWIMTEIGRFPWIVFGLMKVENGVSVSVPAPMVLLTLVLFTVVYGVLMVADIYLLQKFARAGAGALVPGETEGMLAPSPAE